MYSNRPNLVIGFHGCDKSTRDALVHHPQNIKISEESYDWLGHGFYLWENNFERAREWAEQRAKQGRFKEPGVVGAVIDLGHCCDFMDSSHIGMLKTYYEHMAQTYKEISVPLPMNRDVARHVYKDELLRELDCAVIEFMHAEICSDYKNEIETRGITNIKMFDSVRCAFIEGGPAFKGAGIREKNHIQICIRNLNSIKGFFIPRENLDFYSWSLNKYLQLENN
ncbi:hypothetical protein [[Flexibacter] sp. ATCC 35208]|uniref:hypothetical protein n=1 Tax=[Flexibacter] sp. ATCC 35208 TaxID=1936242 RepID=UPI0009D4AF5E|nr:hypothetical protein [[Flexibacter] sp. ATCC 35208]OMP79171.1 hypothetical protein BW716_11195 [[Flexibacter] sp. ATCC 35208]